MTSKDAMTIPVAALARRSLSDPAHVLLLKCAYGHHLVGQRVPGVVDLAATLRLPHEAAEVALAELTSCGVLVRGRDGTYAVRPQRDWRTRVFRPTPGARAVLIRLIAELEAAQSPPGTELLSDRRLAAAYSVHEHDVRWALRLLAMRDVIALPPRRPPTVIRRLPVRRVITNLSGP
ncbi:hypothetical protein ACIBEA_39725 [Streptomyces sp. NPDC051555]|uniref:hypothetical protein n=1 Tax=Streptomyces sp. NPDC051555 TaxID=3365657 RepID=UPI00379C9696